MDKAQEFWNQQAEWSNATFGNEKERGPLGPLKHLEKEAKEAQAEIVNIEGIELHLDHLRIEIADCLFLTFDAARRAGISYDELIEACFRKLEINKSRKWGKSVNGEACEHIRD